MSFKTLAQVMCGSGYSDMLAKMKYGELQQIQCPNGIEACPEPVELAQRQVDEMTNIEFLGFLYFGSFTIMSVFIILNLFIVNVLDTFDCEMRIPDRTIAIADQWGFANVWAGLTLTTAACPSLQVEDAKHFQNVVSSCACPPHLPCVQPCTSPMLARNEEART